MPTIDLIDDELGAVTAAIRRHRRSWAPPPCSSGGDG
jgi:hypothetical protein